MRILFLGDIVGRAARNAVIDALPGLRTELAADFIVINGENAAGGFGITPQIADELFAAGGDVVTTGNHAFDKAEIATYIAHQPKLIRPANMNPAFPGAGEVIVQNKDGKRLGVVNIMTNLFMAENDNAFQVLDKVLDRLVLGAQVDALLVDVHGEATSEKMAIGHYLDGRASVVVGTHTHIPTADHQILSGGTAYQTDAGMCGDYDSVIGMNKDVATARFTGRPLEKGKKNRLSVATGNVTLCGLIADIDPVTGLASHISAFRRGGQLSQTG